MPRASTEAPLCSTGTLGMQRHADACGGACRGMQIPSPPFPHNSYTVGSGVLASSGSAGSEAGTTPPVCLHQHHSCHLSYSQGPGCRRDAGRTKAATAALSAQAEMLAEVVLRVGRSGQGAGPTRPLQGKGYRHRYRPDGGAYMHAHMPCV